MAANKKNRIADNVTLDLFDCLWNLIAQWKMIVIFSLIISIIAMLMTYAKDMRAYNNAGVQTVTIESLHDSMTDVEYETVQYCVRQKLMVEKFQDYLDIAPLQDIDPTNEHVLKSTYVVNGADEMTTTGLVDLYNGYFLSDDFISGLAAMITDEKEQKYASSLIIPGAVATTATSEKETTVGSNVFAVTIILLDDMNADDVASYVDKQVTAYGQKLQDLAGAHQLTQVSQDETNIVNIELASEMRTILEDSYIIRNSIESMSNNFSENQKRLYDLMLEEAHNDGTEEEASMTIEPTKPTLSKKSIVLGFVVGVMLYVFAYLVLILFSKHIHTAKECEDTLDIRTLGELHQFTSKGFLGLLSSKLFYRLKYRRFADVELQKQKIVDSLVAYTQKHADSKMQFVSIAPITAAEENMLNEIVASAKNQGVDVSVLVGNVNTDTSFHQSLAKAGQMILVLCKNRSRYEDIDLCLNLANESQVETIGNVFLDC